MTALLPLDDALGELLARAPQAPPAEERSLGAALGQVLASDLHARLDVPPQDNSAMDGYAVRSDTAGQRLPQRQRIAAGSVAEPLAAGAVARIFTGAMLPDGADAVVAQEEVLLDSDGVRLPEVIHPGQHVRRRGEDTRVDELLLTAGRRLRPQDLGLLASQGIDRISVRRPLRVALLSTGSELREPGSGDLNPGEIYNSNRPMLIALLSALGCEAVDLGIVPDSATETARLLRDAASRSDAVLTTGGVSVGEEDHVREQVAALGEINLWRVAIKPGKPFAFGQVLGTPFLGLPGNPSSAFVTFLLLVRPWLAAAQGRADAAPRYLPVKADFDVEQPRKRCEFLRVRLRSWGGGLWATPYENQSSGVLRSTVASDALVRVPPATTLRAGDAVDALLLDELLF